MANIMDSLFGPTPYDVGQARNQQDMSYAEKVARMGGFEQAKFGIGQGAAGLTRAGAGMMGMVDPLQQQAQMRESVMAQGGDLTTSAGLKAKAQQFAQAGDQRTAMKLAIAAKEAEAREQERNLKLAQEAAAWKKAETEASPFAKINPKDYTSESMMKYMQTRNPADLVAVGGNGVGKTRTYQKGTESITEELQSDGTWKVLGSGPKFSRQVINVNGVEQGKEEFTPEVVDFYATQALLTGDQSWRTGLGRSKDGVKLIIAVDKRIPAMAREVGMTAEEASNNKQMFAARLKAIKDFSTGRQGQMVTSFNTAIDHLDTLKELGNALKNGNMQLANKIKNTAAEWTGDADITNLDTAKQIVGAEIVKAIVANGGGVDERKEAAERVSRISSPEQLAGYIDTTQKLMAGQLKSLERQYEVNTSRKDFKDKLLPRSKSVLATLTAKPEATKPTTLVDQIPGAKTSASVSNW